MSAKDIIANPAKIGPNSVPAKSEAPNTHQKALEVNLDPSKYGVFGEIGAGQEVSPCFLATFWRNSGRAVPVGRKWCPRQWRT